MKHAAGRRWSGAKTVFEIRYGLLQAIGERSFRRPAQQFSSHGNVGTSLLGIVDRKVHQFMVQMGLTTPFLQPMPTRKT
jgi:hypothetical protein